MEAAVLKNKDKQIVKSNLNLLEEKVVILVDLVKQSRAENLELKQKNKELHAQLRALEGTLVAETKDLEELSQEKMVTKMVVESLLDSIDSLMDHKEK